MAVKKTKTAPALIRALTLSQAGDVDGALTLLDGLAADGPYDKDAESLRFMLLLRRHRSDDALAVASRSLSQPLETLARSTWHLRRGLLHLEHDRPLPALEDLQEVLKLRASPDHEAQARQGLLQVALQGRIQ